MTLTRTPGGLGNTNIEAFAPDSAVVGTATADMAEVLVYDSPLNESDRQMVEAYLASKYGIHL